MATMPLTAQACGMHQHYRQRPDKISTY